MMKLTTGMLLGFGAAIAGWWYYSKVGSTTQATNRGEVIFSNTPIVS